MATCFTLDSSDFMTSSVWDDRLVMRIADLQGEGTEWGTLGMSFSAADLVGKCSPLCSKERSGVKLVLKPAHLVEEAK